jgi:hypothetical protein
MKKSTLVNRSISKFAIDNPTVSSADIAKQFKIPVKKVYQMRSYIKRKTSESVIPKIPKVWDGKSALKRIFVLRDPVKREEAIKEVMLHDPKYKMVSITTSDTPMPTSDPVNNPAHYTAGGAETIDFIEAKKLCYHLGNVVKYVTRAEHKGSRLEDLQKARWYLDREIMRITVGL